MNYILEYTNKINSGEIVAGKRIKTVYNRLCSDLSKFDEKKANRPIEFIEKFCRNSKGNNGPIKLELFQKAFISALFGFVDEEGKRQFKESMFLVGRKNGKSTLLSAIALYMLVADKEPGAEVYSIASKKDQAKIIFDSTLDMVKQSPELSKYLKKRKTDLYFAKTLSKMQPLGKNTDTLDGLNASCVIIDELHSIKDRNVYEVMKQSQSSRLQPLLIMITTAGTTRECIYDDMLAYAEKVADGKIQDNRFLPILYQLDNKKEWKDPEAWSKANPGLGTIKQKSDIIEKVKRAKDNPSDLNGILCKDFNINQNSSIAWLTLDDITNKEKFSIDDFKGCYAIGGADLSMTLDLTCATLIMFKNEKFYVEQMYWLPSDSFDDRVKKEKLPYDKWLDMGLVRLCEGNSIRYSDVTKWFLEMYNQFKITPQWIYYDSYSAKYWVDEMVANGFYMVKCIQGAKTLSIPMEKLGAALKAKQIVYNDSPILRWCIGNVKITEDRNGNILPCKARGAKYRIDGLASLLDAWVGVQDHYQEFTQGVLL
jgi:phage terminase large subunit-like protein